MDTTRVYTKRSLGEAPNGMSLTAQKRIWIDLDNSPHVPFFIPIIEELQKKGYGIILSARNTYQVSDLVEFHHLSCKFVGSHWGKHRPLKVLGTCVRALHLARMTLRDRPDLAVSHGSRSQLLATAVLRIPSIMIYDYEFVTRSPFRSDWVFIPDCLPRPNGRDDHVLQYPGLKEDVYLPRFRPDPLVRSQLGLTPNDIVVTMRPPATEAHYHNPESELLFDAAIKHVARDPNVRIILLPRNERQATSLQETWRQWIADRKIVIPAQVMDGLNVIWSSDLVISGGGTMNREAAALGIPVYSVFRGRIGAVDQHLSSSGRLVLLERVEDIQTKIMIQRRRPLNGEAVKQRAALPCIVEGIVSIAENGHLPGHS